LPVVVHEYRRATGDPLNVFCHLALAGEDPERALGQFLGDYTRGAVEDLPYPPRVLEGIRGHRHIDAMTDQHAFGRAARQRLPEAERRYGGIVLDLYCDHLLHLCWDEVMRLDKEHCVDAWMRLLAKPPVGMPRPARQFASIILRYDLLRAYADLDEIADALSRIGRRLRKPHDLAALLAPLVAVQADLVAGFPAYFRDLRDGLSG
jgi:acyl carrier protein phosphodiesterase